MTISENKQNANSNVTDYMTFTTLAGEITYLKNVKVRSKSRQGKDRLYYLETDSDEAKIQQKKNSNKASFELLTGNIQGLLSKKKWKQM